MIVVTFNNSGGLVRTLDSIRALDYKEKETIVIDGGSTDNSRDVMAANSDIIDVGISERDSGIYNAMNKGLGYATGDYVVFMNAGDMFADKNTLNVVSRYEGDIIMGGETYGGKLRTVKPGMTLYDVISVGLNHQAVYYRHEIIQKYGFDESYRLIADFKSVVEPMAKEQAAFTSITEVLAICEGGGVSQQRWRDTLVERRKIVREVVLPYYRDDYVRFADINNEMLAHFIVISQFRKLFPLIKAISRVAKLINKHLKHIPI